jgi:hypothetical protein
MLRWSATYTAWAIALLGTEIWIGRFLDDAFIRPYVGDVLVIPLLYCLITSIWQSSRPARMPWFIFGFAVAVETAQALHIADLLGFTRPSLIRTIIGTHADPFDVLAYAAGTALIIFAERGSAMRRKLLKR